MYQPSEEPEQQSFHQWLCRYLVPMVARIRSFNEDGTPLDETLLIYSGFILRIHHMYFWATAGHCIEEFEEYLQSPHVKICGISLADCFGPDATFQETVPLPYTVGDAFKIHEEDQYLDFALVRLTSNICEQLDKNGVKCVSRSNWSKPADRDFFHHVIVGFPLQSVDDPRRKGYMQSVSVGVEAVRSADVSDDERGKWFVGKVKSDEIETIKGMSGGPIFGFWHDDEGARHYCIFALQSWWDRKTRIVRGCTLDMFAEVLHRHIEEIIRRFEMGGDDPYGPIL